MTTDADKLSAVTSCLGEVLGVPSVDPRAGFYDLGGHSLLIVAAIALLRERHGLRVDSRRFLENGSAEAIAASSRPLPAEAASSRPLPAEGA